MYLPQIFQERDPARARHVIESHPFGTLVATRSNHALEIAHLPFLFDADVGPAGRLRAHVARANPLAELCASRPRVTVIFHGPDAYVSPSWYEDPSHSVPTWNYAVVHANGRLEGPLGWGELTELLDVLTARHEAGGERPWRLADLDESLRARLLAETVGISITVEALEAKLKLSQNQSAEDSRRVRERFEASDDPAARALAKLM